MAGTVRFTEVTKAGGMPEVYLPFADPCTDKSFMRAVKEQRVVSLKQEPVGNKKDFGVVRFLNEKFVTYLVFPKSLKRFEGKRIIGIHYEELEQSEVATPEPGNAAEAPHKKAAKKEKAAAKIEKRVKGVQPAPEPVVPKRLSYTAKVRITGTAEMPMIVEATSEDEATERVRNLARDQVDWSAAKVEVEILSLRSK